MYLKGLYSWCSTDKLKLIIDFFSKANMPIEIVFITSQIQQKNSQTLEVAFYKKKARQNLEYKDVTYSSLA